MRLGNQVVSADRGRLPHWVPQVEYQQTIIKFSFSVEDEAGEKPEPPSDSINVRVTVGIANSQPLVDILVEMLEECTPCIIEPAANLLFHLLLRFAEGGIDRLGRSAFLVNCQNAFLEIDPGFDRPKHFVRGAEYAIEEPELLREQFEDALVGGVAFVQEIDDHHVVFLPVAMTATDPLFDRP